MLGLSLPSLISRIVVLLTVWVMSPLVSRDRDEGQHLNQIYLPTCPDTSHRGTLFLSITWFNI